jgi:hypothetical protein
VLSVDEKSQIQALDRTQPGLPVKKDRAGTMTHDYKRPTALRKRRTPDGEALHGAAHHGSVEHVHRREQGRRPVPLHEEI